MDLEYQYLVVFSSLLLIPKLFQRFRIPGGITCLFLGVFFGSFLGWFENDQLILILSRLGITSLFLFAGMEIEVPELRKNSTALSKFLLKSMAFMLIAALVGAKILGIDFQLGLIASIAIFTPSAGFILNSIKSFNLESEEVHWVKMKAISKEIAAIFALLFALQINEPLDLLKTLSVLSLLVVVLPIFFKGFVKWVAPYVPDGEVGFLVIMALISGVITKKIGTHYLLGAFVTGVIAGQFKHFAPSKKTYQMIQSLSTFFSIFVTFYFFKTGLGFGVDKFNQAGFLYGVALAVVFIPLRMFMVKYSLQNFVDDEIEEDTGISISLIPNLIFGLVIIGIIEAKFEVTPIFLCALITYTVITSILPALYFTKKSA